MLDLEQFEGHSPEPWSVTVDGQGYEVICGSESPDWGTEARYHFIATLLSQPWNLYRAGKHREVDGIQERKINARVLAAGPALIAEVKQLRAANEALCIQVVSLENKLAALREAMREVAVALLNPPNVQRALDILSDALAKEALPCGG